MTLEEKRQKACDAICLLNKNRWKFLQKAMEDHPDKMNETSRRAISIVSSLGHPMMAMLIQTAISDLLITSGILVNGAVDDQLDDIIRDCARGVKTLYKLTKKDLPEVHFDFDFGGLDADATDS
jgi:hypothetical protein